MALNSRFAIAALSSTVLILELAFIRLIPAEVKAVSYFTNLILFSSFFGLGVGCILARRKSLALLLPFGTALVALLVLTTKGLVVYSQSQAVHFWLEVDQVTGTAIQFPLFPLVVCFFVAALLPFIALGQLLAQTMDRHPRLEAYSWDIGGSIVGTLLFAISSALEIPPWIWPVVLMIFWGGFGLNGIVQRVMAFIAAGLFCLSLHNPLPTHWSPYYLVQHQIEPLGLRVWVNSSFHQLAVNFSATEESSKAAIQNLTSKFQVPYNLYRERHEGVAPKRILILGAGTGNDVVFALQQGAEHVTAVEIDPQILKLGRTLNVMRPYDDPRVSTELTDVRHFLQSSHESFDLIIFGTLDSQTLLSGMSNIRLENYVYTVEAVAAAKKNLASDGVMAFFYSVYKPWLYERIYSTVQAAMGDRMRIFFAQRKFLLNTIIIAIPDDPAFVDTDQHRSAYGAGLTSTDDWPFFYLERPGIPVEYLYLMAFIFAGALMVFIYLRNEFGSAQRYLDFFFLGVGFTLMEAAAVVRMALLFGSTWIINIVVFASVLCTIFIANVLVLKHRAPSLSLSWLGLILMIGVNLLLPVGLLSGLDAELRVLACALLIGLPVFFAAVCFSRLFESQQTTGLALGINLVGAMAGGVLEYSSMLIGMKGVWLIVLVVYLTAFLAAKRNSAGRAVSVT